tara:strand:+ start:262 stop:519 length:258 start_codon:yes stop_codon:yes gene_type:complete
MSKFGDLIGGEKTTEVKTEVQPTVTPVVDTTPASVEDPVNPEPLNFWNLSKDELEDYGRTIGIELDRRHSKSKLIKQLENYIDGH